MSKKHLMVSALLSPKSFAATSAHHYLANEDVFRSSGSQSRARVTLSGQWFPNLELFGGPQSTKY